MAVPSADVRSLTGYGDAYRWNLVAPVGTPTVVTYSFSQSLPDYDSQSRPGFQALSSTHQTYIRKALDVWAQASGLAFVEVPDTSGGQVRFSMYDMSGVLNASGNQASGFGYYPRSDLGGDVYLNANYYGSNAGALAPGQRGYSIVLHEIGHAIGFKHPFEGTPTISSDHDQGAYTIMSYDRPNSTTALGSVDIEASQYYYGTTDRAPQWDAATLTLTQTGTDDGQWILGIEVDDVVSGQGGDDTILSFAGDDRLFGGAGHDSLSGGDGADLIYGNLETDRIDGGAGADTLYGGQNDGPASTGSGAGADGFARQRGGVETLSGGAGGDVLYGNYGGDLLFGGDGDDSLYGGQDDDTLSGGAGADALFGNRGDDVLVGGAGADLFVIGPGADTVQDFSLAEGDVVQGTGTYTVTDGAAGVSIVFDDGASVILVGVTAATLTDGAFV